MKRMLWPLLLLISLAVAYNQGLDSPAFVARLNPVFAVGGAEYTAYATTFSGGDGTNWLERDADLTGNADGLVGSISLWYKPNGVAGYSEYILVNQGPYLYLEKQVDNTLRIEIRDAAAGLKVRGDQDAAKSNPITNGTGWTWIAMSWDNSSGGNALNVYINGVEALEAGSTYAQDDADLDYTRSDHSLCSNFGAGKFSSNCLMEVWINYTNYIDWSDSGNRGKFYNAGSPVDLGSDGTAPGFGQPIIYLKDAYTGFTNNYGYGGLFKIKGDGILSDCATP